MITVLYALLILSPVAFIVLLPLTRTARWRRWAFLSLLFTSFLSFLVIVNVGWVMPRLAEQDDPTLADVLSVRHVFAEPLRTFFGSGWLMAGYMLAVVAGGYLAKRGAARRAFV